MAMFQKATLMRPHGHFWSVVNPQEAKLPNAAQLLRGPPTPTLGNFLPGTQTWSKRPPEAGWTQMVWGQCRSELV